MTHPYWPLFDLRLTTPDLVLAPLAEGDLAELADVLPDDLELNPAATAYELEPATWRAVVLHQEYWRAWGTWSPASWALTFGVRDAHAGGRLVGAQTLEGADFPVLRTVDSASWLVAGVRGQGWGQQMRTAALALAFGPLAAQAAVTSAWHDNAASLGVSRALGYQPGGEVFHRRDGAVDTMVHLRLTRAGWLASGLGRRVGIEGFEACRPYFGLGAVTGPTDLGTPPSGR